jgi:hypothetical protein
MSTFPPLAQTVLPHILPAYVFQQYSDDDNIQALDSSFNGIAQQYHNWLVNANLPVYTKLSGSLLDWMAAGLYGITRPSLPYGSVTAIGPFATTPYNTLPYAGYQTLGVISQFTTTDDIFKRIITWYFFKGDGQVYSTIWLKRRVMRFLIGTSGTAPNIDNTYPISIFHDGGGAFTITITLTPTAGIVLSNAQIFQAAVQSRAVCLPFQYSFTVDIVNDLGPTGLMNNGGLLGVAVTTGWPTSPVMLGDGKVWLNGGLAAVIPGMTPNPFAAPLFFGLVTSAQLLLIGGGNLPLSNPGVGTQQIWNNGGMVGVA